MSKYKQGQNFLKQPSRKGLNQFYRLQTKKTEKVANPILQKSLDSGTLNNDNINNFLKDATFLVPTKIKVRHFKQNQINFFLLSQNNYPTVKYLPIFTDWNHLGKWYFSISGKNYNNQKNIQIAAIPSQDIKDIILKLKDNITHVLINPVSNDFVLSFSSKKLDQ